MKDLLAEYLDRRGSVHWRGLNISVKITDVRQRFDKIDVLVEPISGSGEQWVMAESVRLEPQEPRS